MELKKRGISVKVWQHYRIGWNDQRSSDPLFLPGLMLPAFVDGKLWQLVIRPECGRPKYLFVEGGTAVPFGLDVRQGCSDLVICEGELDALLVATVLWGKADIIALCGTAKNIRMWLDYLWHYKQVFLCLDGDRGGQEAAARIMGIRPTWQNRVPPKDHDDMCKLHYAQFDLFKFIYMNRLERSKKQWTL